MTENENKWPDLSGRIEGDTHILPIRVYFEDTDFTGIVYHANHIKWCERARTEFVRLLGLHHHELLNPKDGSEPCVFAVRRIEIDYLRPARIDDIVEIHTRCAEIGKVHMDIEQHILSKGEILAKAMVKIVVLKTNGKLQRVGPVVHNAFANLNLP